MKTLFSVVSFLILSFAFFGSVRAAPGDLDVTFDIDGLLTSAFSVGPTDDEATGVVLQPDGKIVAAGYSDASGSYDFALIRYNPAGSLDTSFDTDGRVTTDFTAGSDDSSSRSSVALQSDGKIVMAGRRNTGGFVNDFALARYNPDGSLDTSFDTDGKVTTDISGAGSSDSANGLAIQEDGKIVVAGAADFVPDFVLVRYNPDGSLDTSFDTDGKVTTDIAGSVDDASAVAVQADGKIVAGGRGSGVGSNDFALVRYNADGSLDTSFDSDGKVITDLSGGNETVVSLAIQSDGKIVAAGSSDAGATNDFILVRYNTDGSLDISFDTDGVVITDFSGGDEGVSSLAVQADGKIVAAGSAVIGLSDFMIARYNPDGSLDTTFGTDGKVTTGISVASDDFNPVLALQTDGKIVAAGSSCLGFPPCVFALVRYEGDVADLVLSKTAGTDSVSVGDTVTYTMTVTNNGPQAASGVTVTDDLPAGVTLDSATATQGTCTGTDPVTCNLGSLAKDAIATVTITLTADAAGTVSNSATVAAVQVTDPDSSNNADTAPDVTVTESGGGCSLVP